MPSKPEYKQGYVDVLARHVEIGVGLGPEGGLELLQVSEIPDL